MTDLHKKTIYATLWSAIDVFMRHGVQFLVLILLARILTPKDFGIIAMLNLFVGIANIFIDSGFSAALIQKQNSTQSDEDTLFFFNLAMGAVVALLLAICAPWIASYFKEPVLHYLSYAMAINLFINAFGSIHTTLLTKELNFKTIAKVGGVSSFISGLLALALAYHGFGVWSLAAQTVASGFLTVVLLWAWHPWRPAWTFCFSSLRSFFKFGSYLMIGSLADVLHANLYSVLISKYYSVRDVGLYDRAQKTQMLPVNFIMTIINRVAYSVFSATADDKKILMRGFRKAQQLVMFINIPLMVSMIVLAEPIISVLFGNQWLSCAPILQVLGWVGMMWPLHILNLNILKAQGRTDLFFGMLIIKKVFAISLLVGASFYGIMAIAWAQVAASVFGFAVNAHYSKKFLNYGAIRQIRDLLPFLLASIPSALGMWLVLQDFHFQPIIELSLALITGATLYLLTARALRIDTLFEIIGLLKRPQKINV